MAAAVVVHSGTDRSLRPLPCEWTQAAPSSTPSTTRTPTISDTRAPVLYSRLSSRWSRCEVQSMPGLALAVDRASIAQPSLKSKRISPHTLRHTTAMHLLQSGVPFNVIALWLGHESTNTTHRYVEANLEMKEKALARLEAPDIKLKRFRATDDLMKFLQTL